MKKSLILLFSFLMLMILSFGVGATYYGASLDLCPPGITCYPATYMLDVVEWEYNDYITGYITNITVLVYGGADQQNSPDIDDYVLKVNGYDLGTADEKWVNLTCNTDATFLAWNDYAPSLYFESSEVLFELSPETSLDNRCWKYYLGDQDGDGDSAACISYHVGTTVDRSNWNGVYDGDTCYDTGHEIIYNITVNSTSPYIENYVSIFGDTFVEFYNYDVSCEYRVGEKPSVVYNLSDANYSSLDYYRYDLLASDGDLKYAGIINFVGSGDADIFEIPYIFTEIGQYYVKLYNVTSTGSRDELVWTSQFIVVCDAEDTSGSAGTGSEDDLFGFDGDTWFLIVGVFIVGFCLIMPSLIRGVHVPSEVNIMFGVIGAIACTVFGFFPIWVIFVFALLVVAFIVMKLRR